MNRIQNSWGLFTSPHQSANLGSSDILKQELLIVPSTSTPVFGSTFIIDFKQKGVILNNISLAFNVGAVSGLTPTTAYYFIPAIFWITKMDVIVGGVIIDTLYGQCQFLKKNLFSNGDEDRKSYNQAMGSYSNTATQLNALATASSQYIVDLDTVFNQSVLHFVDGMPDVQLRITLDTVANCLYENSATGTASATISSCNLLAKVSRTSPELNNSTAVALKRHGALHNLYHSTLYMPVVAQSGISTISIPLTALNGNIAGIFFTVQPTASLIDLGNYAYTQITSYNILSNGGNSLVGGQPISDAMSRFQLGKYYFDSTFLCETTSNSYVYFYSFSCDIKKALETGSCLGSHRFSGAEILQINFASALTATNQINIWALQESCLELTHNGVRKLYISN